MINNLFTFLFFHFPTVSCLLKCRGKFHDCDETMQARLKSYMSTKCVDLVLNDWQEGKDNNQITLVLCQATSTNYLLDIKKTLLGISCKYHCLTYKKLPTANIFIDTASILSFQCVQPKHRGFTYQKCIHRASDWVQAHQLKCNSGCPLLKSSFSTSIFLIVALQIRDAGWFEI